MHGVILWNLRAVSESVALQIGRGGFFQDFSHRESLRATFSSADEDGDLAPTGKAHAQSSARHYWHRHAVDRRCAATLRTVASLGIAVSPSAEILQSYTDIGLTRFAEQRRYWRKMAKIELERRNGLAPVSWRGDSLGSGYMI